MERIWIRIDGILHYQGKGMRVPLNDFCGEKTI
jgi:hypothetical protein